MKSNWLIVFALVAIAVVIAIVFDLPRLYLVAKPLLMITLLLHFISASRGYPSWRNFVMAALVFSWGGDVFLMNSGMFIPGLASFLVAHILYIITYHKTGASDGKLKPLDLIKFVLFGAVLIWVLYPGIGDLLIPVILYALTLLGMGIYAHKRRGATSASSFMLVSIGAILFVLSDSLIAINKFVFDVPAERLLVMSTYITAQYLIIQGLLKHEEEY
jgi:uncharacterized membrane protein YhhN